ncbi:hypothetical protein BO71DRAFT_205198 [Aspergillus ellipticus CBS 707.79]|uniref:Uncharacterized protein n=1 Tax=Aspergillus ellipticus CBS 707.79 TaxID=1448320 RepID=A0A319DMK2_9EURO|nr:hypothetical protein BO71DRAFT_205198 [Aspergillus ellipticus CBS 707.79]
MHIIKPCLRREKSRNINNNMYTRKGLATDWAFLLTAVTLIVQYLWNFQAHSTYLQALGR